MQDSNTLPERISGIFAAALNVEVPSPDTDLFETGLLDSLAFVQLLLHLEQEFGVTTSVDELELDNFRTIGRIADFLRRRAGRAEPRVVNFDGSR